MAGPAMTIVPPRQSRPSARATRHFLLHKHALQYVLDDSGRVRAPADTRIHFRQGKWTSRPGPAAICILPRRRPILAEEIATDTRSKDQRSHIMRSVKTVDRR